MSVIGRMDKQVDEILISPLARRNAPVQDGQIREAEIASDDQDSLEKEQAPVQSKKAKEDALPVWLL